MTLDDQLVFYAALVVAVILHEISHGVVALFYGDDTAKRAGRLTLNPIPHIDPVGSVLLPALAILGNVPVIGWAKPVPVNPAKLRNPRRQMLYVGLVGPFTNFALMAVAAYVARSLAADEPVLSVSDVLAGSHGLALQAALMFALVNLFLGVFNMLPIPPLDGSSLIERVLSPSQLRTWYRIRPYGFLILFAGLFLFDFFGRIISPFLDALVRFVFG